MLLPRSSRLRARFTLAILALFLLTGAISLWVAHRITGDIVDSLARRFAVRQVLLDHERILAPIMTEVALARQMAASPLLRAWAQNEGNAQLKRQALVELDSYRSSFRDGSWFYIIDASKHYYFNDRADRYRGRELTQTLSAERLSDLWYFNLAQLPVDFQLNPDFDVVLDVAKVWINVPVRAGDKLLAIAGTGIDIGDFVKLLIREDQPDLYAMLINAAGAIQAHPNHALIDLNAENRGMDAQRTLFALLPNDAERSALQQAMNKLLVADSRNAAEALYLTLDGKPRLVAIARIGEIGWFNLTVMDTENLIGNRLVSPFIVTFTLSAAILLILLIWLINRMILVRIERLDRSATAIAGGDYTTRVADSSADEIGALTRAFNHMAQTVSDSTAHLEARVAARTAELSAANAELERARDAAEAATRVKSQFLANMSHEIRTPMNGVLGMSQLLSDTRLGAQQQLYAQTIRSSAESLLTIINDILDFSKIEAHKLAIAAVDFDLRELLKDLGDLFALRAAAKGLAYRCEIAPDVPARLVGDPDRLRQVLTNFVANAIKFTERGEVVVNVGFVAPPDDAGELPLLRCAVTDTGIGIAEDKQPLLFAAFTQVDGSNSRKYGGTGLGLAISKQLAELMGGAVGLRSAAGQGSTFWFTVRLGRAAAAPRAAPPDPAAAAPRQARVLVTEDNRINQILALELLKRIGIEQVDIANDGSEALAALAAHDYDLVLMDCQMPVMDGFEATATLRARGCRTPIVAMTANAMQGDREACLAAGMDDYIAKPVKRATLEAMLAKWLPAN